MTNPLRPTRLEIDTGIIAENVRCLCANTDGHVRLMAVVKADGYGHGAVAVARAALPAGAQALGVAMPEEGVRLREEGIGAPILVLGGIGHEGAEVVAAYGLTQTVFDMETVGWLSDAAVAVGKPVCVHIKVDSGMGRIGVRDEKSLLALADRIHALPGVELEGVYTHFAQSDAGDLAYTQMQHQRFLDIAANLLKANPHLQVHAANSAAALRAKETHHDMVRAGIALYVPPQLPQKTGVGLRQAMRWVTRAVYVKEIEPGESVSYGSIFTAERPTRVMTLPVGYADGYHRAIGGRGCALVHGQRAPVIGRVCMDQTMLDVTDIPGAAVDDEVVLLGGQGGEFISAHEMGTWCGMIDYEVLLSPSSRVPRVYR